MAVEEVPNWEDELSPEQLRLFQAQRGDPRALVTSLREDREFQLALARADTRPYLLSWFSETEGWLADEERSGPIGEQAVGTEWSWTGVHDDTGPAGAFNGIAASGRPVTVSGFTLMSAEGDRFTVRRYVDWAGLFAQLGLTLNWRVPVPGRRYETRPADAADAPGSR